MNNTAWGQIVNEACQHWRANLSDSGVQALMRAWWKHFGHLDAPIVLRAVNDLRDTGEMYLPSVATMSAKVKALLGARQ